LSFPLIGLNGSDAAEILPDLMPAPPLPNPRFTETRVFAELDVRQRIFIPLRRFVDPTSLDLPQLGELFWRNQLDIIRI
jgi:hypothetical protein